MLKISLLLCIHITVCEHRQMGATQSIAASYTLLPIPPFHSSSLKAQIFGTNSSLGGKSYRVEKSGRFSLVIFGANTAWDNSSLWVPDAAVAVEPSTKRCHWGSCWTKRWQSSSFYGCLALAWPKYSPPTQKTVFVPRHALVWNRPLLANKAADLLYKDKNQKQKKKTVRERGNPGATQ